MIEIFARDLHNQEDESYEEKREADEGHILCML